MMTLMISALSLMLPAQAADMCTQADNVKICQETWTYAHGAHTSSWEDLVITCEGACDVTVQSAGDGYRVVQGDAIVNITRAADNLAVVQVNGSRGVNVVDVSDLDAHTLAFLTPEDTLYTRNAPRWQ
ncbi:MAG: hypothetical protein AAFV53_20410 [Myxococcota bacterium]